jgi:hypothetical protein
MKFFLAILTVLPLLVTNSASAADFSGTYVGFVNCKITGNSGEKSRSREPITLQISQPVTWADHADLGLLVNGFLATGRVIFDPKKPEQKGTGIINDCAHINSPDSWVYEISHFSGNVKPGDGKGKIRFTTIAAWRGIDGSIATCKGVVKRVNRIDPGVGFCEMPAKRKSRRGKKGRRH